MKLSVEYQACRDRYEFLSKEFMLEGFSNQHLELSFFEFSELLENEMYLKPTAYKPTGLALGCALPSPEFTAFLFNTAKKVAGNLKTYGQGSKTFAFVPSDFYHVTIVNYSHFTTNRNIQELTSNEFRQAAEIVNSMNIEPISIRFRGLIPTRSGTLIVPGFPSTNDFFALRNYIANKIPRLQINLPNTAHIKLGHFLPLSNKKLMPANYWDAFVEPDFIPDSEIEFTDIFSPVGRINL